MKTSNFRTLFLINLTFMVFACNQKTNNKIAPQTTENIDLMLNELHQAGKFNGNILVVQKGKKLYEQSFGYADASKKELLSSGFNFSIGSIYKEFPAVAIMQLSEAGKLKIDDPIQMYLPDLPQWAENVTIKNLLQYSSGLPRINFGKYFSANKPIKEINIYNDLLEIKSLEFQPGADYLYSNNNPFLLIKIVEKVSGQRFQNYVEERLFAPHNLKNTIFKEQFPYKDNTAMALPFNANFELDRYKINVPTLLLTSNAADLYHWIAQLHAFKIISKASLNFLTETAAIEGKEMQAPLGNCLLVNKQITEHTHHGTSGNYECLVQHYNSQNLSIIILTNQKNGNVFDISENIRLMIAPTD